MRFSYNWIQSHIEQPLPAPKLLREVIIFHAFEVETVEEVGTDTVFDIKVLPDRAGDCFSHRGMAREIAGLLKLTLKEQHLSEIIAPEISLPIEIKNNLCDRYIGIQIDGVTVGPSPAWLVERLNAVGQKSINNVVDATNFVLLDSGQPVHAFDTQKIDGGIAVRLAHEGEKIITLSHEEKQLRPNMLVIADYLGSLAIAGVKGGNSAEVTDATTSVVVEVAHFDAISVRTTSRSLNLITDASKRFENNLTVTIAHDAALQVAALITDIAGGTVTGIKDIYPQAPQARTIAFAVSDISRLLGNWVTEKSISDVFDQYHYEYTCVDGVFTLTVPVWRADITGAHDIAEEVGRVVGYDTIESKALPFTPVAVPLERDVHITAVKQYLAGLGFREVMTYSFRPKGEVYVAYGAKGKSALRSSLSEGLKESFELNRVNAQLLGEDKIKLFEIGTVFFADREEMRVGIVDNGVIQELSLEQFITEHAVPLDTNAHDMRLQKDQKPFQMWSVYPYVSRDIAVWLDAGVDKSTFEDILQSFAVEYCARSAYQIDEFSKEGRTSVAYRLIFQAQNRTLTEQEVHGWYDILIERLKSQKTFEIR